MHVRSMDRQGRAPCAGRRGRFPGVLAVLLLATGALVAQEDRRQVLALEMQEKIAGYVEEREVLLKGGAREVTTEVVVRMSLLGQDLDLHQVDVVRLSAKGVVTGCRRKREMGNTVHEMECRRNKNQVHVVTRLGGEKTDERDITLDPGTLFFARMAELPPGFELVAGSEWKGKVFLLETLRAEETVIRCTGLSEIPGEERQGRRITMSSPAGGESILWLDPDEPLRLLRLESPAQGLVLRTASPVTLERLQRADLTDTLFTQVRILVADYRQISRMVLDVDIDVPGEPVTPASLQGPGQKFDGTVAEQRVRGRFEILSFRYNGADAPSLGAETPEDVAAYLVADPEVECGAEDIRLLAEGLSKGLSTTWEASGTFARWISANVQYAIPGGGTALATLRARRGECGGQSRLHVALCRAAGIPARQVAGAMYTPAYGGSFGQHAWSEVWMGRDLGWIAVDPTAGEPDYADAGHVRLGERVGFRPRTIRVVEYEPKSAGTPDPDPERPLPFVLDRDYAYTYSRGGTSIGRQTFRCEAGEDAVTFRDELEVQGLGGSAESVFGRDGRPVRYKAEYRLGDKEYSVDCRFGSGVVSVTWVRGGVEGGQDIPLHDPVFLFDNNHLEHFSMICSRFELSEGLRLQFSAFHPSTLMVLPVVMEFDRRDGHGEALHAQVKILTTDLEFWVAPNGRVLRDIEAGGALEIRLEEGE